MALRHAGTSVSTEIDRCRLIPQPADQKFIAQHQHHGAYEEPDDAGTQETTDSADEDHGHGDIHAATQQERLKDVVDGTDGEAPDEEEHKGGRTRIEENIDEDRDRHQKDADLCGTQQERQERPESGRGHPSR